MFDLRNSILKSAAKSTRYNALTTAAGFDLSLAKRLAERTAANSAWSAPRPPNGSKPRSRALDLLKAEAEAAALEAAALDSKAAGALRSLEAEAAEIKREAEALEAKAEALRLRRSNIAKPADIAALARLEDIAAGDILNKAEEIERAAVVKSAADWQARELKADAERKAERLTFREAEARGEAIYNKRQAEAAKREAEARADINDGLADIIAQSEADKAEAGGRKLEALEESQARELLDMIEPADAKPEMVERLLKAAASRRLEEIEAEQAAAANVAGYKAAEAEAAEQAARDKIKAGAARFAKAEQAEAEAKAALDLRVAEAGADFVQAYEPDFIEAHKAAAAKPAERIKLTCILPADMRKKAHQAALELLEFNLMMQFGGYTVEKARGGWLNLAGDFEKESSQIYNCSFDPAERKAAEAEALLVRLFVETGQALGETELHIERSTFIAHHTKV